MGRALAAIFILIVVIGLAYVIIPIIVDNVLKTKDKLTKK